MTAQCILQVEDEEPNVFLLQAVFVFIREPTENVTET
jgi:hypothetical protein